MTPRVPAAAAARKIGIDLDGVLCATAEEFLRIMEERHGRRVPLAAVRGYRLEEWTGLSAAEVDFIFSQTDIFERAQPLPGAADAVRRLRAAGWETHIVTYRAWKPALQGVTREWLRRHDIPYDIVELVPTPDKSAYARAHGLPVFVEDNWHSIEALARTCNRVILLDWPYNQGPLPANTLRAADWPDALRHLGVA